jgi:hypothetical protein
MNFFLKTLRSADLPCSRGCFHYPVIVAMIAMRMVEVAFHHVVGMAAVWNRFVSATGPVFVAVLVSAAIVIRGARFRVLPAHVDLVLVDVVAMWMVKVPIVDVILVAVVL